MMDMKYIIYDNFWPIIFPFIYNHIDMANHFLGKVTSAGFIDKNGKVYGYSDSLSISSKESDQRIIDRVIGNRNVCIEK